MFLHNLDTCDLPMPIRPVERDIPFHL